MSSLLIAEIKRIIKESEIMKLEPRRLVSFKRTLNCRTEKMIQNGRRKIRMDVRNWRSGLEMSTFHSRSGKFRFCASEPVLAKRLTFVDNP